MQTAPLCNAVHCCDLFFPGKKGSHYFGSMNTLEAIFSSYWQTFTMMHLMNSKRYDVNKCVLCVAYLVNLKFLYQG